MSRFNQIALALAACIALPAWSAASQCPEHFAGGVPPTVTNAKLQARTQAICFQSYATLHSGISRTPVYSAEHLTRANIETAKKLSRRDSFHAESQLAPQDRAELSDYSHSGYDRGHLAPNKDMPSRSAQAESFSLANMVPQGHASNAGVWEGMEGAARQMALDEGEVYVVSGPAFIGNDLKRIGNVLMPTHLWKVLYSPAQQRAGAYVTANDDTGTYSMVSVSKLEKMVGVSALPGLPRSIRDNAMALPKPSAQHGGKKSKSNTKSQPEDDFTLRDFSKSILDAIKRAGQH